MLEVFWRMAEVMGCKATEVEDTVQKWADERKLQTLAVLQARIQDAATEALIRGHGEGQMHALQDLADIIEKRLGTRLPADIDRIDAYLAYLGHYLRSIAEEKLIIARKQRLDKSVP